MSEDEDGPTPEQAEQILNTIFENSDLMVSAITLFNGFTALVQAGFNEGQAMYLVGEMVKRPSS